MEPTGERWGGHGAKREYVQYIYYLFTTPKFRPVLPNPFHGLGKTGCETQLVPRLTCRSASVRGLSVIGSYFRQRYTVRRLNHPLVKTCPSYLTVVYLLFATLYT